MCTYRCNQKIPAATALRLFTWLADCATKIQVVSSRIYLTPSCFSEGIYVLVAAEKARCDNGM